VRLVDDVGSAGCSDGMGEVIVERPITQASSCAVFLQK
jgi:hypothetical protein